MTVLILIVSLVFADHADTYAFQQLHLPSVFIPHSRLILLDLYYIMEQLTTLRSEVVQRLLESTSNIRIKRMFLYMAEKAGYYWFEELDTDKMDLGAGKLQLVKNGVLNKKYSITVPKELDDYEG